MEHKIMHNARNMAIGIAIGTAAAAAAGAVYLKENKPKAKRAVRKIVEGKKIITQAGESIIREMNS